MWIAVEGSWVLPVVVAQLPGMSAVVVERERMRSFFPTRCDVTLLSDACAVLCIVMLGIQGRVVVIPGDPGVNATAPCRFPYVR